MTPQELIDAARNRYNSVGDTFWSDSELFQHVYEACMELAHEAFVIESYSTTVSVAATASYAYPTRAIAIRRVVYDGKRLEPISMRDDDLVTFFDSSSAAQGEPDYYYDWDDTIYLRPIPDTSALVIGIFAYSEPAVVTAASTLEVPTIWQVKIIDYVVSKMALKEQNFATAEAYAAAWAATVQKAKAWTRKKRRSDSFSSVREELYEGIPGRF